MLFQHNEAKHGAGIYITDHSTVVFDKNSDVMFFANSAKSNGGAVYLNNSTCLFDKNSLVTFSGNEAVSYGGAIFSENNSNVVFKESCNVTFRNTHFDGYGAAIASIQNSHVTFTDNAKVTFFNNRAEHGTLFSNNSHISFAGNSITIFSNNVAFYGGGAIKIEKSSHLSFKGTSSTKFVNNRSGGYGGIIHSNYETYLSFEENSKAAFTSTDGTTIYLGNNNSYISFKGNSSTTFNFIQDNDPFRDYIISEQVAIFCNGKIYFEGSSSTIFNDDTSYFISVHISLFAETIIFANNSVVTYNKQLNSNTRIFIASYQIIEMGYSKVVINNHLLQWCTTCICEYIQFSTIIKYYSDSRSLIRRANIIINRDTKVYCSLEMPRLLVPYVCKSNKCKCESLEYIMEGGVHNNSLNISNKVVSLSSFNVLNFSLIGHNTIVYCNQSSELQVKSNDLIIEGITWIGCGRQIKGMLSISNCSNITIQTCSFQFSEGQIINITDGSRDIHISDCKFVNNKNYKGHGMAILSQSSSFTINNCYFSSNEGGRSVIYFEQYKSELLEYRIFLINSSFCNNKGVSIYLNHYSRLQISGDALFDNNVAKNGTGIYIDKQSTLAFSENSNATFIKNHANGNGAAIFMDNQSSVLFDNNSIVTFINNKATNGIIYAKFNSNIKFKAVSKVIFSNNSAIQYGASIYSIDSSHILFTENSTVTFIGNMANDGGAVTLFNNSTATVEKHSNLTFSNNVAKNSGGALYAGHNSDFHFTDKSIALFEDSSAKHHGNEIYLEFNSNLKFQKNSVISFITSNRAVFGETMYLRHNSIVTINSNVRMNGNAATWNYGSQLTNESNYYDITIDANGTVRCSDHKEYYICTFTICSCKNLEDISSNSAVIITGDINLFSAITLTKIVNISITGYNNNTIFSTNDGGLRFVSCKKVTITNLVFRHNISRNTYYYIITSIELHDSSDVTIENCTFLLSTGQEVVLSEVSDVSIKHCKFESKVKHLHRQHGAAIHYSSSNTKLCEDQFVIDDCYFANNSGIYSLIFLEHLNTHACSEKIFIQNSKFYNNRGTCICLSNQNLHVKGNLHFENNFAENGASMFIDQHSTITFGNTSNVTFSNNTADISGGAIYLNNWSNVIFENYSRVNFSDNEAMKSGGSIYLRNNSSITVREDSKVQFDSNNAEMGGTLYITNNSFVRTEGSSLFIISNSKASYGGAIYCTHNCYISIAKRSTVTFLSNEVEEYGSCIYFDVHSHVTFEGNTNITINHNKAKQGGTMYLCHNSHITLSEHTTIQFDGNAAESGGALHVEKNSSILVKGNSMLTINNSEAKQGGAIYLTKNSKMITTENSNIAFVNNEAEADGGCVYSDLNSRISFEGNSTIAITDNRATHGGAFYSTQSNLEFGSSSEAKFDKNIAMETGGSIHIESYSQIQFRGTCEVIFRNSTVTFYNGAGGAIYCGSNSFALFEEKSKVIFHHNRASDGGATNFVLNSSLMIKNNSIVKFTNNSAITGGAVNVNSGSYCIFEGNSTLLLKHNVASNIGGAFHLTGESYIEFERQVKVKFNSNTAALGGAIYCSENSSITFGDMSNTLLSGNSAENGGGIFLTNSEFIFTMHSYILFKNNTASQDGGAIYLDDDSHLNLERDSNVTFSHNTASDYGGAMYGKVATSKINFSSTRINFDSNSAGTEGNSVYITLPKQCNDDCLSQCIVGTIDKSYIITSPIKIQFYNSNIKCIGDNANSTTCNIYYINNIMLGQQITLDGCMYDYYGHPADAARFLINGDNDQGYSLGSNNTLISCNRTFELVNIHGNRNIRFNYSLNLTLYDNRQSELRDVFTTLMVELSSCHSGFRYNAVLQKCECYNAVLQKCECYNASDIVFCSGRSSTIKAGYWFGRVNGKSTVTTCPINYCDFTCCETSNGYYQLSPERDNQCRQHRFDIACGNCIDGYTLSFDSTECVNIKSCTAGQTALVILLSMTYWAVMVMLVFAMMYYSVGIGYLYSITYYYSIVDILLSQNLYASRGLYLTVNMISSFSKITPQFLGELCLTTGMTGIDQQFIHYIHPAAIIIILILIVLLAKRSRRISAIIRRGIIHVICLLLLLSYTSIASTSLLLMRPLTFFEIDNIYTYVSPNIEYFHGRHLAYGIVALLCAVIVAVGLPFLLILEPFLNRKINFVKIKPLLDQFQGCYKDQYRCFAGYYMICRLVIITILIINSSNITSYILIAVCGIISLVHVLVKPYNDKLLNRFDAFILQLIILITALPLFDDIDSSLVITVAFVLVILPLLNFIVMILFLNKNNIKKIISHFTINKELTSTCSDDVDNNETAMKEFNYIVDDSTREKVKITVCDM